VSFKYCRTANKITFENQAGISYSLQSGDEIFSIEKLLSVRNEDITVGSASAKKIYASYIRGDSCFAVTYILPASATFNKIEELPLAKGSVLGEMGDSALNIDGKSFSILLQIQQKALDPKLSGQEDYLRCTVVNKQPLDLGPYIQINPIDFD
jgi:hypothetical protein